MSATILLVEDNPNDIDLTRRAFAKARLANDLVVVEDGAEALDYLFGTGGYAGRDAHDFPALTLLDINLPKVSGLQVLEQIRRDPRTHRMPVAILTSSDEERDVAMGYDLGVNSYIRKPVDFAQLAAMIQQLGLYWLVLNVPPPRTRV